jgi:hypothetical protein
VKRITVLAGVVALLTGLMFVGVRQLFAIHPPALCTTTNTYTVCTSETDYSPEESVPISGFGFGNFGAVTVRVTRPDGSVVTGDGSFNHGPLLTIPWQSNLTVRSPTTTTRRCLGHYYVDVGILDFEGNFTVLATTSSRITRNWRIGTVTPNNKLLCVSR